jgi:predicted PurR-regulated permease PerM
MAAHLAGEVAHLPACSNRIAPAHAACYLRGDHVLDPQHRKITIGIRGWLTAAAVFASAVLIWEIVAGALPAFVLLFTGILVACGLRPGVDRLRKRMPFGAAVGTAFGSVTIIVFAIGYLLLAPLGTEVERLVTAIPGFVNDLQGRVLAAEQVMKNDAFMKQAATMLGGSAGTLFAAVGSQLVTGPARVAGLIGNALIIVLLAVGWMLTSDELAGFVLSLFPPPRRNDWRRALETMGQRLSAYVQGIVVNGLVVGIVMGIALILMGVPYALLLGFVTAILQAIPMVGAVISGPIVLLVVLATGGWGKMLVAAIIFTVVQILDQNVLSPVIFGSRVQLSFLLIIFATITGGMLLGIGGAFLAVPIAAVLQVIVVQLIAPAIRRANAPDSDTP